MSQRALFIPGWAWGSSCWDTVISQLPSGVDCEVLPWESCLGKDNALVSRLESCEDKPLVIGWSLGALIALAAAERYQQRIKGLVLVSATARLTENAEYPGADSRNLRAMILKLKKDKDLVLSDFVSLCAQPDADAGFVKTFTEQTEGFSSETLAKGLNYFRDTDLRSGLTEMDIPVSLLHGTEDRIIPNASASWLAGRLPNASYQLLPDKGHALPFTAPEEIAKTLSEYL